MPTTAAQEESRQTRDDPLTTPMTNHASIAATSAFRGPNAQTALVFQGGGALGAYQGGPGVYQALAEA
jgi:predicted acylesterase/phospholipase RssA